MRYCVNVPIFGPYTDAGVTWWMEAINHWRGPLSAMRERIRKGPPRAGR